LTAVFGEVFKYLREVFVTTLSVAMTGRKAGLHSAVLLLAGLRRECSLVSGGNHCMIPYGK